MSDLVFVGYTNGHQLKYAKEDEGVFYPDTDNECYIPLYMLKTHWHRIESTSDFNVTHEEIFDNRIADLERQLRAEREINDRLRVVETERATRNDELYEVIHAAVRIQDLWVPGDEGVDEEHRGEAEALNIMLNNFREILDKHKDEYGERPLKYIAIQYSRGVYGSLFDSEQDAREEHPYADEIIPIRVSGDYDGD